MDRGPRQGPGPSGGRPGPADGAYPGNEREPPSNRAPQGPSCWGPAVACSPAFGPRPPRVDRPLSEEFVNSGWKEKKLWKPEVEELEKGRGDKKLKAPHGTRGIAGSLEAEGRGKEAPPPEREEPPKPQPAPAPAECSIRLGSVKEAPPKSKAPKPARSPQGPLEVLDPESSSDDDEDGHPALPPEFAVLDMNVPRTALVINVSHVLKRLSGCCALSQLTRALKTFKDNSAGVTLEQFLRANPDTFLLEGRIVHLLDRSGEKWKPPPPEELPDKGRGKGRGKDDSKGKGKGGGKSDAKGGKGDAKKSDAKGGKGGAKGKSEGKGGKDRGKGSQQQSQSRHQRGGGGGGGAAESWDDAWWSDAAWNDAAWLDSSWYASEWSTNDSWKGGKWKEASW